MITLNTIDFDSVLSYDSKSTDISSGLKEICEKIVSFFRNHIWPYISAVVQTLKNTLMIITTEIPAYIEKLKKSIAQCGISSAVSVLLGTQTTYYEVQNLKKSVELNDIEGGLLHGMGTIYQIGDTFGEFCGALFALEHGFGLSGLMPLNVMFSLIAFPLAICLISYRIIKAIYNTVWLALENASLPSYVDLSGIVKLKEWLKDKLTDCNRHILIRRTDEKIVNIMENIMIHLNSFPLKIDIVNNALNDIKTICQRKIGLTIAGMLSQIAQLVVFIAAKFFGLAFLAIPSVLLVDTAIGTTISCYQNNFLYQGLKQRDFL